jgi:hypothetical protein
MVWDTIEYLPAKKQPMSIIGNPTGLTDTVCIAALIMKIIEKIEIEYFREIRSLIRPPINEPKKQPINRVPTIGPVVASKMSLSFHQLNKLENTFYMP